VHFPVENASATYHTNDDDGGIGKLNFFTFHDESLRKLIFFQIVA